MAKTTVSHVTLTVSTVEAFINTMKFISEKKLWGEVQSYFDDQGRTEMFLDYEVLDMFREMLKQHRCFDPEDPVVKILTRHRPPKPGHHKESS